MLPIVLGILQRTGVRFDEIRTIDHEIPAGMEHVSAQMLYALAPKPGLAARLDLEARDQFSHDFRGRL